MSGGSAIPISEVCAFLQVMGIASRAERAKYLSLIQDMDQIWLDFRAKQQPAE